jgi:uncharacterized membrane protein
VLVAVAPVVLVGLVGIAIDSGVLWGTKRKMQTAADAAAVAGAVASRDSQSVTSAADNMASLNGFTNGSNSVSVTVTCPYSSGSCAGISNCVKVNITS